MSTVRDELTALTGTYQLLARLWMREVDEQLLASLCQEPLREYFLAAGGVLPEGDAQTALEELAIDFCQLFLGPSRHLPPFQSVWQRGQFQGEPAESMRQYVSLVEYETDGQMGDHLGVQLDVMARLLQVWESNLDSAQVRQATSNYFAQHLTWHDTLVDAALHRTETDFYRSVIRMTRDFLKQEASTWDSLL